MKTIKVRNILSEAWEIYKPNWAKISLFGLVMFILSFINSLIPNLIESEVLSVILQIISIIVSVYLTMGSYRYLLNWVDGKEAKISDLFHGPTSVMNLLRYIVVSILVGLMVFLGLIAFIVPGVILGFVFYFISISMVDKDLGIIEAIKYNWELTKGYKLTILRLGLLSIGITYLGVLAFGVGVLAAIPVVSLASIILYRKIQSFKPELEMNDSEMEVVDVLEGNQEDSE